MKDFFESVRAKTTQICLPLETEDFVVQPREDVSPPKWHLAHTTWFFEEFVLRKFDSAYGVFDENYHYLFNSYYDSLGEKWERWRRGCASRPTVAEVMRYRSHVDEAVAGLLARMSDHAELESIVELGLHHEMQHQELLYMDIQEILSESVSKPVYDEAVCLKEGSGHGDWVGIEAGLVEIGVDDTKGFAFCNEGPRHQVYLASFEVSDRLVTCGEYQKFIEDGGYEKVELWHSEGWKWLQKEGVRAPLHWQKDDNQWFQFRLDGFNPVREQLPVSHVNFFEASAFAEWKGCRLPTEAEWEHAAACDLFPHDRQASLWEWTGSAYLPYPGYKRPAGALGEYNGKWMCSQMVLRGGSYLTPEEHYHRTYRNFFYPHQRWQFSGFRLARS